MRGIRRPSWVPTPKKKKNTHRQRSCLWDNPTYPVDCRAHLQSLCHLRSVPEVNKNLAHLGLDEECVRDAAEGFAGRGDKLLFEAILAEYINSLSMYQYLE